MDAATRAQFLPVTLASESSHYHRDHDRCSHYQTATRLPARDRPRVKGKGATMTTHNNTPKDQYRRAPLNGLIIGTIVGAVWAIVFVVFSKVRWFISPRFAWMTFMGLSFPLLGWIDGLCEKNIISHRPLSAQRHEIKMLYAATLSMIGIATAAIFFFDFFQDSQSLGSHLDTAPKIGVLILYLLALIPFPYGGWALVAVRMNNSKNCRRSFVSMTLMSVIVLLLCVICWFVIMEVLWLWIWIIF